MKSHTANPDSINKIVTVYFACMTNQPIEYRGKIIQPKELRVSPLLLRDFTCPPICGGCCPKFTLDYIPGEDMPDTVERRYVNVNGVDIEVFSDLQEDNKEPDLKCKNLNRKDGRCGIYLKRPFSCDFELIRFMQSQTESRPYNQLVQRKFGRGWMMKRVDGGRGSLCEMTPITPESIIEVKRKLSRLEMWLNHFNIVDNKLHHVLKWIDDVKDIEEIKPLRISASGKLMEN